MAMLQAVFREATVWERLPWNAGNPVQPVKKPAARRRLAIVALPPAAVEELRAAFLEGYLVAGFGGRALRRTPGQRRAALIGLRAYEGLRPEEVLALEERHLAATTLL